jgi:hypothetical protein
MSSVPLVLLRGIGYLLSSPHSISMPMAPFPPKSLLSRQTHCSNSTSMVMASYRPKSCARMDHQLLPTAEMDHVEAKDLTVKNLIKSPMSPLRR